jgi:SAM-dependent methyltransferase
MSMMDMADLDVALAEVHRVLRSGGFLQFSIEHRAPRHRGANGSRNEHGRRVVRVGGYFDREPRLDAWIFGAAPEKLRRNRRPFRIPRFPRTLSTWLNAIASAGLIIEAAEEPYADNAAIARHPQLEGTRTAPLFLHLRCRKAST